MESIGSFGWDTGFISARRLDCRSGGKRQGRFHLELDAGWTDGKSANLCIGQDPVLVSPMQVAVLTSALANGGKVLWPRLVDRNEPHDPSTGEPAVVFAAGRMRNQLGVSARGMKILHDAMLADVEDEKEGSGHRAGAGYAGLRQNRDRQMSGRTQGSNRPRCWFASSPPMKSAIGRSGPYGGRRSVRG